MKLKFIKKQDTSFQILFFCLALFLGVVLYATESLADEDCKQAHQLSLKHFDVHSTLCIACCNAEHSKKHCHNRCSVPIDLPNAALTTTWGGSSDSFSITADQERCCDQLPNADDNSNILTIEQIYKSPPIFLQNESFLI